MVFGPVLSNGRQRVGEKRARRKSAFQHSYTEECGDRVSECMLKTLACRGLRVGPSKGSAFGP